MRSFLWGKREVYRGVPGPGYHRAVEASVVRLDWECGPLDVLAAWPPDRPVAMLHSGRLDRRFARWSIITCPLAFRRPGDAPSGQGTPGDPSFGSLLEEVLAPRCGDQPAGGSEIPFGGGWIGYLSYDLGRELEPAAAAPRAERGARTDRDWPRAEFAWCPGALVYDGLERSWHAVGAAPQDLSLDGRSRGAAFRCGALRSSVSRSQYL